MKAFIGEPADASGNVVPCTYCDRAARISVQGEPRCMRHVTTALPPDDQRAADAARRARLKGKAGRSMMRRGVQMPAVERVTRRQRGSDSVPTIVSEKPEPKKRHRATAEWPDAGGVDWAFEDARKQRA